MIQVRNNHILEYLINEKVAMNMRSTSKTKKLYNRNNVYPQIYFFHDFPAALRPCTGCPLKQFQNSLGSLPSITRAMGTSVPRPWSVRYCTTNFMLSRFSALFAPFPIHTNTLPPPSRMKASLLSSLILSSLPEHTSLHSIT